MLDVIHYFFEEDYRYTSVEQANFKDGFRETMYKGLYDVEYEYTSGSREKQTYKDFDENIDDSMDDFEQKDSEIIEPFSPRTKQVKSFIEPSIPQDSSSRPFGQILDEPLA